MKNIVKSKGDLKNGDVILTMDGSTFIKTESPQLKKIKSEKSDNFDVSKISPSLKNTGYYGSIWDIKEIYREGQLVYDVNEVEKELNLQDLKDELAKKENEITTLKVQNDVLRIENKEIRAHSNKLIEKLNELERTIAWNYFLSELKGL